MELKERGNIYTNSMYCQERRVLNPRISMLSLSFLSSYQESLSKRKPYYIVNNLAIQLTSNKPVHPEKDYEGWKGMGKAIGYKI